jgi:hypothetical protein
LKILAYKGTIPQLPYLLTFRTVLQTALYEFDAESSVSMRSELSPALTSSVNEAPVYEALMLPGYVAMFVDLSNTAYVQVVEATILPYVQPSNKILHGHVFMTEELHPLFKALLRLGVTIGTLY